MTGNSDDGEHAASKMSSMLLQMSVTLHDAWKWTGAEWLHFLFIDKSNLNRKFDDPSNTHNIISFLLHSRLPN